MSINGQLVTLEYYKKYSNFNKIFVNNIIENNNT